MCFDAGHANVCGDNPRLSWNEGVRQNRQLDFCSGTENVQIVLLCILMCKDEILRDVALHNSAVRTGYDAPASRLPSARCMLSSCQVPRVSLTEHQFSRFGYPPIRIS